MPPGIHAGGLRYHGASPLLSHLLKLGQIEAKSVRQLPVFEAAVAFARTEGILPAPESAHAIRAAVDEALLAREEGRASSASSTAARMACADSGAGRIPSVRAKATAASNTGSWEYDLASIWPSLTRWLSSGDAP